MADLKISQLTAATTPLAGTEVLPIVQSSTTVKVAVSDLTAGRAISATAATLSSGNLAFSSTAQRITGDFSNATLSSRVLFQTSTTNGASAVGVIPNGTGTITQFAAYGGSDPANAQVTRIDARGGTESRIESTYAGTPASGTYLPMTFYTGGSERVRIDTSGNVGIGTASPASHLDVSGSGTQTIRSVTTDTSGTAFARFRAVYSGGGGGAVSAIDVRASDGVTYVLAETNSPLLFGTNNTERMRITSAGNIVAGASAALATNATDGFLYVPTCAGTPTGTPTAITGMAPIVVNTTNNKLYFYSGGAWRDAGP